MKVKNDVQVLINGRKIKVSGYESPEFIQKVATYINSKYSEFNKTESYSRLDVELRSVLLAMNIADDFFKAVEDYDSVKTDNAKKDKLILNMKHEILENRATITELKKANEELTNRANEAEKTSVAYKVRGQDAYTKANGLEEKLSMMQIDKGMDKKTLEESARKIESLEKEIESLKANNQKILEENKKLKDEVSKNNDVIKEREELSKMIDDANTKIKQLEEKPRVVTIGKDSTSKNNRKK